ncbi:MAG: glycerol-3-phosphate 1-O-acyltransferase PlsY [Ruminococcaceae bacterium]|nr:glycerol-3-phosphate 1-O-acyltransferase PlsY [Oscillospiraceae bacterium]
MTLNDFFSYGFIGTYVYKHTDFSEWWHMGLIVLGVVLCIIVPYLLGSINFAIVISKRWYGKDIREFGSGNAGMTNMMRTFGKSAAGFTLLGDALKAFVAGFFGYAVLGQYGVYIAGLFCIMGHIFPIYYRFRGGKGVVTAYVSILMCNPFVFLILLVLFVLIVLCTRYISLGSIMCMLLYPVLLDRMEKIFNGATGAYVIIAMLIAALVIFMHRENIKRLLKGQENKFSFKKSVKTENEKKKDE